MVIPLDSGLSLELIEERHATFIFEMVNSNREYLRSWLSFVDKMQSLEFAENFVKGTMQRNLQGLEYAFIIIENEVMVGRVGVYKIDTQNKIGEIGYWIIENKQGKGIITRACRAMIDFCFNLLQLNRIEIKCGVGNTRSMAIAERLDFTLEGIIRQGELLYEQFIDLNLYSLLKTEQQ